MDKMRMETADLTARNVEKIAALFPNCVTEALDEERSTKERKVYKKVVNFELLRQMLSDEVVEGDEAYEFTWVGKKAAIVEAHKPIRKTLRPCPEESVNWDTTENLYIEGDNLEVLKLLQESYLGKVKMIYIDPPYNTGHDFVYPDSFIMDNEEYNAGTGYFDEDGNVNFSRENSTAAGKYHSDWCSMMYSRLLLARDLLTDDGVIFISIDDNEVENLTKICNELFDKSNHQATITYVRKTSGKQDSTNFMNSTEFILVYSKSNSWDCMPLVANENVTERYNKADENGRKYRETDLRKTGTGDRREDRPLMWYPFYFNPKTDDLIVREHVDTFLAQNGYMEIWPMKPDGTEGRWRWGYSTAVDNIAFLCAHVMPKYASKEKYTVYEKDYIDKKETIRTVKEHTSWDRTEFNSDNAMQEFKNLGFSNQLFPFPKSSALIKHIVYLANCSDSIILDFFSGSATTAHAVMQLNAEEMSAGGGHPCRKFIMVQLPEPTDKKSEAFKAGYKNICEIGKERIRRAGKKILEENADKEGIEKLDVGFRVLKLDDSNMNDVYYAAGDYTQDLLRNMESNIKDDRTDLDLLFGCLLEWGLPLSLPYTSETIEGVTVHTYNDGDLVACFDENIPDAAIKAIAKKKPLRAVSRDSGFADSPAKINAGEIFKMLSPDTRVKVI